MPLCGVSASDVLGQYYDGRFNPVSVPLCGVSASDVEGATEGLDILVSVPLCGVSASDFEGRAENGEGQFLFPCRSAACLLLTLSREAFPCQWFANVIRPKTVHFAFCSPIKHGPLHSGRSSRQHSPAVRYGTADRPPCRARPRHFGQIP